MVRTWREIDAISQRDRVASVSNLPAGLVSVLVSVLRSMGKRSGERRDGIESRKPRHFSRLQQKCRGVKEIAEEVSRNPCLPAIDS